MAIRADRIYEILTHSGGRLRVGDITTRLAEVEDVDSLNPSLVPATVSQDNRIRENRGEAVRFNIYGDETEEFGYISIRQTPIAAPNIRDILANYPTQVPALIERANQIAKEHLKQAISELTWQHFESLFLQQILEALGFHGVEITQRTRDGGMDALCWYKRGLVRSGAIVSAKHWQSQNVSAEEIQRLRGIRGNADTGIIVTSGSFSDAAKREAEPQPESASHSPYRRGYSRRCLY